MEPESIIASLSLLLSVSLAVFYIRDRAHAKYAITSSYTSTLLDWHNQVIEALMRFKHATYAPSSQEYRQDLAHLSALIEHGRFFFPNIDKGDAYGAEKPIAYRGYRNLALEFLVSSYDLLSAPGKPSHHDLDLLQRHFTSIVFDVVRPKERLETIRGLTDKYFVKDYSAEDFVHPEDNEPFEVVWEDRRGA